MRRAFLFSLYMSLFTPCVAMAQNAASYMRAMDLLSVCRTSNNQPELYMQSFCETYVAGIIDYHNLLRSMKSEPPVTFCIPEQYSLQQVTEIVLNDLSVSPQHDHFIAAPAVTLALFKAFPCKTTR